MATLYVVTLKYIKSLEEVDAHIPAHIEWLKQGYADGVFLASGRQVPRVGGVILAQCANKESLIERLQHDPFSKNKLVETVITAFEPSMCADALKPLL